MDLKGFISKFTSLNMGDIAELIANQTIVAVQNSRNAKIDNYEISLNNQWVINTEDKEFNLALKESVSLLQKKYDKYSIYFKRGSLDDRSICLIGVAMKQEPKSKEQDEFDVTVEDNTVDRLWRSVLKHSPRYLVDKWRGFEDEEIDNLELEEDITDITYSLPYKKNVWIGKDLGVIMVINANQASEE